MAVLGTILNFVFRCKKTNGRLGTTVKFRICCEKANDRLGTRIKRTSSKKIKGCGMELFYSLLLLYKQRL